MLERLGEQLLVVREAALNEPRRQRDVPEPEYHLVLERGDLDVSCCAPSSDATELLERAGRNVRLQRAVERLFQRCLLDAQAIGVGRDHAKLAVSGRDEDAGEVWTRLVPRGGACHAVDRLHERRRRELHHGRLADLGQPGELLGGECAEMETRWA